MCALPTCPHHSRCKQSPLSLAESHSTMLLPILAFTCGRSNSYQKPISNDPHQLSERRLQNHGGIVHSKGLIPAPIPSWLQHLLQSLPRPLLDLFPPEQPPNHVLINSYQPGCGIMVRQAGRRGACRVCAPVTSHSLSCHLMLCWLVHATTPCNDGPAYQPISYSLGSSVNPAVHSFSCHAAPQE